MKTGKPSDMRIADEKNVGVTQVQQVTSRIIGSLVAVKIDGILS